MLHSEQTVPTTSETLVLKRLDRVLPPDKATLDLAATVGQEASNIAIIAAKFSETTGQENLHPGPIRELDMGSGTSAFSIVMDALRAAYQGGCCA